jgi:hypothetical protein
MGLLYFTFTRRQFIFLLSDGGKVTESWKNNSSQNIITVIKLREEILRRVDTSVQWRKAKSTCVAEMREFPSS